jgi:hypothetical protein
MARQLMRPSLSLKYDRYNLAPAIAPSTEFPNQNFAGACSARKPTHYVSYNFFDSVLARAIEVDGLDLPCAEEPAQQAPQG